MSTEQLEEIQVKNNRLCLSNVSTAIMFLAVKHSFHQRQAVLLKKSPQDEKQMDNLCDFSSNSPSAASLSHVRAMLYFSGSDYLAPAMTEWGGTGRKHNGTAKLTAIGSYIFVKYCTQPFPLSAYSHSQKLPT